MSVPHSLDEAVDQKSAWEWFCEVARNLNPDLMKRIQDSQISLVERKEDGKIDVACLAWNRYLEFTHGVIMLPDQVTHIPA